MAVVVGDHSGAEEDTTIEDHGDGHSRAKTCEMFLHIIRKHDADEDAEEKEGKENGGGQHGDIIGRPRAFVNLFPSSRA